MCKYDLKLKCEHHGLHAAFLDLDITVVYIICKDTFFII